MRLKRQNKRGILFAFALSLACFSGCAQKDAAQRALETVYARRDRAVVKRDLNAYMSDLPEDFVYVNLKGNSYDRDSERKKWNDNFTHSTSFESAATIQGITGQGDRREANVKWIYTRHYTGPESGNADEVTGEWVSRDTWEKRKANGF